MKAQKGQSSQSSSKISRPPAIESEKMRSEEADDSKKDTEEDEDMEGEASEEAKAQVAS